MVDIINILRLANGIVYLLVALVLLRIHIKNGGKTLLIFPIIAYFSVSIFKFLMMANLSSFSGTDLEELTFLIVAIFWFVSVYMVSIATARGGAIAFLKGYFK